MEKRGNGLKQQLVLINAIIVTAILFVYVLAICLNLTTGDLSLSSCVFR